MDGSNRMTSQDDLNDPPLLEDLGIDIEEIKTKLLSVFKISKIKEMDMKNGDLFGPFLLCILFSVSLLLKGKIQFGFLYGIVLIGCLGIYTLINLMSQVTALPEQSH